MRSLCRWLFPDKEIDDLSEQTPKINYIIPTWTGLRVKNRTTLASSGNLTYNHILYLRKLNHNLSQITIGAPKNPDDSQNYLSWLRRINNSRIGTAIVRVVEIEENEGMSYGQFARIFKKYGDIFDYYIFTEDDYVPAIDNFDTLLVDLFDKQYKEYDCGYLCGMVCPIMIRDNRKIKRNRKRRQRQRQHGIKQCLDTTGTLPRGLTPSAAVSWGISSSNVLTEVCKNEVLGHLPYEVGKTGISRLSQVLFSQGFPSAGFVLRSVDSEYYVPYWGSHRKLDVDSIIDYGVKDQPAIIVPIEYASDNNLFEVDIYCPF